MSNANKENTFASGKMSLESLWRLLEQQGRTNASMASVVGLDEAKIRGQDTDTGLAKHGMTTIGNYHALPYHNTSQELLTASYGSRS